MARTSNVFKLSQEASMKDVLQFMQRVNDVLKTYKSPGQKRPKKRFTPEEMKALATPLGRSLITWRCLNELRCGLDIAAISLAHLKIYLSRDQLA